MNTKNFDLFCSIIANCDDKTCPCYGSVCLFSQIDSLAVSNLFYDRFGMSSDEIMQVLHGGS